MIKNAFVRAALLTACTFGLVCCGGGGGGSSSKKGVDAGNLIPETASDFEIAADFLGLKIDFDCSEVVFTHATHAEGQCSGNCSGTLASSSGITIRETGRTHSYQNVTGNWAITFNGDYYTINFTDLKEGQKNLGYLKMSFRAYSVNEGGAVRLVSGDVFDGEVSIRNYTGKLSGSAAIKTEPVKP